MCYAGCEVKIHAGPCFVDEEYSITRELVAVGETPKTEFTWTRTVMHDSEGKLIAEMTLQNMMLKGTIDDYDGLRAAADADTQGAKL